MAKINKRSLKTSSNQSNTKQLNKLKPSNNRVGNLNPDEENKHIKVGGAENPILIRQCRVKLIRLKSIQASSTENNGDIRPELVNNCTDGNNLFTDKAADQFRKADQNLKKVEFEEKRSKKNPTNGKGTKNSENHVDIAKLKTKHNINKEIQIKLVKLKRNVLLNKDKRTSYIRNKKDSIINNFIEDNDENHRNINKRKLRNRKVPTIMEKETEYHNPLNRNFDELNKHSDEKGILKNTKQNQIDQINTNESHIARQCRRNMLNQVQSTGRNINVNTKQNSIKKSNMIMSKKRNSSIKMEKLNNILEKTPPHQIELSVEEIINKPNSKPTVAINPFSTVEMTSDITNNFDIISIDESIERAEIQKETFFRGLRNNNMSNINEFEFGLAKNIQKKQEQKENKTKNFEIKSKKNEKCLSSTMENQTTRETKKNKRSNQIIENIENIEPKKLSKLSLTTKNNIQTESEFENNNNHWRKFTDNKFNNNNGTVDILNNNNINNRRDNEILITKDSKEKSILNITDNSAILEKDIDDNLINKKTKQISKKSKKFFKLPVENSKSFVKDDNNSDIFNFQSSQSDSNVSLNKIEADKDVIKKLVEQGKAEVAKYKKGTGRLNLKRIKKPKVPVKQRALISKKNIDNVITDHSNIEEDYRYDNIVVDHKEHLFSPKQKEIGYSPLARSAMKKYASFNTENKTRVRVFDKKKLLEAAKAFLTRTSNTTTKKNDNISITPKNNSTEKNTLIRRPTQYFDASTPWRSPNLMPRNLNYQLSPTQNLNNKSTPLPVLFPNYSHENDNSQSFNLSNIENVQPVNKNTILETNPRKGLTYRSPLKNINIVEVINLPPLAINSFNKYKTNTTYESDISNNSLDINKSENISDIFNFDEIITDTADSNYDSKLIISKKNYLNNTLKKLKHNLPKKVANTSKKPTRISLNTIKQIYNRPNKQKKLPEMLCSTMISDNTQKEFNVTNENEIDESVAVAEERSEDTQKNNLHLFDDLTGDSTFTLNSSLRTYERPKRRKKMRHDFITCMSSEDEEEDHMENVHKKQKKTHEKEDDRVNELLTTFYKNFNSECEDVDRFELIVVSDTNTQK